MERIFHFLIIISLMTGTGCLKKPVFRQQNAVWAESAFLRGFNPITGERISEDSIKEYSNILKRNNIKYVYLFAGPFGVDGHLPRYPFGAVKEIRNLQRNCPGVVFLPWIGGIQNKTVFLGDSSWVRNAVDDTNRLVSTLGLTGAHIDLEYIDGNPFKDPLIRKAKKSDSLNYAKNVNSFHRKLRLKMPNAFLSSVVVAPVTDSKPWKRKTSIPKLRELVNYIDQVSFLYYDTHIHDQPTFARNCKELINVIHNLRTGRKIQYLISIGTFTNPSQLANYHDLKIENIPNSIKTVQNALVEKRFVDDISGISIFCDWLTDSKEWDSFYNSWINCVYE